jgi:hypothetical protein
LAERLKLRKRIAEIQIINSTPFSKLLFQKRNKKLTLTVHLRWKVSTGGDRHQVSWHESGIYDILKGLQLLPNKHKSSLFIVPSTFPAPKTFIQFAKTKTEVLI